VSGSAIVHSRLFLLPYPVPARVNQQLAGLTGVAPCNRDSGALRGKRRIRGGRHGVRTVLIKTTLTSAQHNPVIRDFYQHLVVAGKHKKIALTACIRKMVIRSTGVEPPFNLE
jgi:transposase